MAGLTITQIGFTVQSIARSKHFYCDVLGVPLVIHVIVGGHSKILLRLGSIILNLTESQSEEEKVTAPFSWITLEVPDLPKTIEEMQARGAIFTHLPDVSDPRASLQDPDGNWIGLSEAAA